MEIGWPDVSVSVCSQYVKRLFDNVTSNLIKYADADYPIRIAVAVNGGEVGIIFHNTVRNVPLHQDGTHIGVVNMETMMKKMNGVCEARRTDKTFRTGFWFPVIRVLPHVANDR